MIRSPVVTATIRFRLRRLRFSTDRSFWGNGTDSVVLTSTSISSLVFPLIILHCDAETSICREAAGVSHLTGNSWIDTFWGRYDDVIVAD